MTFSDLNRVILKQDPPTDVSIVAAGGFPIINKDGVYHLLGNPVSEKTLSQHLKQALGLGAVLTFKNPNRKSLSELGDVCVGYGHLWTLHVVNLTLLFYQAPLAVRDAFSFDRRYHLSWVENEVGQETVTFTATGSLKEWAKMQFRKDDKSFKRIQRKWFARANQTVTAGCDWLAKPSEEL